MQLLEVILLQKVKQPNDGFRKSVFSFRFQARVKIKRLAIHYKTDSNRTSVGITFADLKSRSNELFLQQVFRI